MLSDSSAHSPPTPARQPLLRKRLVVAHSVGQLGNRLFLSAYLYAFAQQHGVRVLNPALAEYADFFEGSVGDWWVRFPPRVPPSGPPRPVHHRLLVARVVDALARVTAMLPVTLPGWSALDILDSHDASDRDFSLRDPRFLERLRRPGLLLLRGWKFRDRASLAIAHPALVRYFTPVRTIQEQIARTMDAARKVGDWVVGIHVRQGDYAHWLGGKYFFPTARYAAWMREITTLWPQRKIAFVVCSNTPPPLTDFPGLPVVPGPGEPVSDLYTLAECDAILGPPSTFSLWASFYGQKPLHMVESIDQEVHPTTFTHHTPA
jgi:hypothetical protein